MEQIKEKKTFGALVVRSVAFLLPLLLILALLSAVFEPKNNTVAAGMESEKANGILAEPENTIDVLFIGDSECHSSFSPMQLWEEQGFTSYVCGTHAQDLLTSYRFLKKALRTQSPKVVILETNAFFRRIYSHRVVFNAVASPLPIFRYHDRWKTLRAEELTQRPNYTNITDDKGFYIRHDVIAVKEQDQDEYMTYEKESRKIRRTARLFLRKINRLCREHDIQLILVSVPSTKNWNYKKHNCIQSYADKQGLTYLDLNLYSEELGINWNKDSKDGGDHLNLKGAKKVTHFFGPWLKDTVELPDRRLDPDYQSWNDYLERYHKNIQKDRSCAISMTWPPKRMAEQLGNSRNS